MVVVEMDQEDLPSAAASFSRGLRGRTRMQTRTPSEGGGGLAMDIWGVMLARQGGARGVV